LGFITESAGKGKCHTLVRQLFITKFQIRMKTLYVLFPFLLINIITFSQPFSEPIPVGINHSNTQSNNGYGGGSSAIPAGTGGSLSFVLYDVNEQVSAKNLQFTSSQFSINLDISRFSSDPLNIEMYIYNTAGTKIYESSSVAPGNITRNGYGGYKYITYQFMLKDSIKLLPGKYFFSFKNPTSGRGTNGTIFISAFQLYDGYNLIPNAICNYIAVVKPNTDNSFPSQLQIENLPTTNPGQNMFFTSGVYLAPVFRIF
jgi:hypothetical protein